MMAKLLQTSPIEQKEPPKVNKNFIFLVPVKNRVPLYGHYMMGIVLKVNAQSHRWFRNQSIQQPIRNMILEDILFYFKKGEVTKAFIQIFLQHKSLVIVLYLVYHIGLQQCWTRVWKNQELGLHSSPLCFTLLRSQNSFDKNLRKRHNFCKYAEQMVSTLSRWWLRTSPI